MRKIFQKDIIAVFLLTFIPILYFLTPPSNKLTIAIIPYILLMLFLPGYSIIIVLSPENNKLIRKILLGIPVSIIILSLFDLSFNYFQISSKYLLLTLALITLFFAVIGYIRRLNDSGKSGYIVCEKCGGHYRLKEGETLGDFKICHCGGKLEYAKKDFKPPNTENKSKSGKYQIYESRPNLFNVKNTVSAKNQKSVPIDIFLVWLITVLCVIFVLTPRLNDTILRSILGVLLILFLPGYSLIAALFPKKGDLKSIERFALSFGLSIAVTPLMGLILNYTPLGIRLEPILISVSMFTLLMGIIAFIRRIRIPDEEKFNVEFKKHYNSLMKSFKDESKGSKILSIILLLSIVLAILATTYLIVVPKEGEKFTEFYILGPNGNVSDYPTNLTAGQDGNVTIGIINHEYANVNYDMVIKLNNQTIDNETITLSNDQSYAKPFKFTASSPGQNQELEFLLYKSPDDNTVYRSLHLWINTK